MYENSNKNILKQLVKKFFFWLLIIKVVYYIGLSLKNIIYGIKLNFLNHLLDVRLNYVFLMYGIILFLCVASLIFSIKNSNKVTILMLILEIAYYIFAPIYYIVDGLLKSSMLNFIYIIGFVLLFIIIDMIIIMGIRDFAYDN